jgi:nucleotide-binding universal stress UspA family protein
LSNRLLLAIGQFEPNSTAVDFTIGLAALARSEVQVLHVRELSTSLRVTPLETAEEAHLLVDETVRRLQTAGVKADGEACSVRETHVARRIVNEASEKRCSAIILGSLRLRGLESIMGHGTRERVLKLSSLPVIVTPPTLDTEKWKMPHFRRQVPGRFHRGRGGVVSPGPVDS